MFYNQRLCFFFCFFKEGRISKVWEMQESVLLQYKLPGKKHPFKTVLAAFMLMPKTV